jgi:polyferredoxin
MVIQIVFASLFLVLGIIYGKLFCGKICPVGMIQDLAFKIPFPKKIKTFKGDKILRYLKYAALVYPLISLLFTQNPNHSSEDSPVGRIIVYVCCILFSILLFRHKTTNHRNVFAAENVKKLVRQMLFMPVLKRKSTSRQDKILSTQQNRN